MTVRLKARIGRSRLGVGLASLAAVLTIASTVAAARADASTATVSSPASGPSWGNGDEPIVVSTRDDPLRASTTAKATTDDPTSYIVRTADRVGLEEVTAKLARLGVVPAARWEQALFGVAVALTPAQVDVVRADLAVVSVDADPIASIAAHEPVDPYPWGLDRVDQRALPLDGGYDYARTGAGVTAYIVDTGIRATHLDFGGRVASGYSAIADGNGTSDCDGHGTHVAGTVGGGFAGVAKAVSLVPVRVLGCDGTGTGSQFLNGVDWIIANHQAGVPAIANMSLGFGARYAIIDSAVQALVDDGVTVVAASGNDGASSCDSSPGGLSAVLTVGATDWTDTAASWSNYGSCTDLLAPGVDIVSDWYTADDALAQVSGTSMASPHVAGAAALLLEANPASTPAQIASMLDTNATNGVLSGLGSGDPNKLLYTDPTWPVTVTTTGTGSGTVTSTPAGISCGATCTATFRVDSTVTLQAAPETGSVFASWSGAGCSGTGSCVVSMNAAKTVTATFASTSSTLTVTRDGTGSGTVTSTPAGISCGSTCSAPFPAGATVTLQATPAYGSLFAGWSGGGCTGTDACVVTMDAAATLYAEFEPIVTATAPPPPAPAFVALVPARLFDSRTGGSTVDGQGQRGSALAANSTVTVTVRGRGGVGADAAAVALNVTVTNAQSAGYLTVFPCGSPQPNASNVNFAAHQTIPNAVVTKVDSPDVCVYTSAETDLLVDVNGYFPPGAKYEALVPARLMDSRAGTSTVDGQQGGSGVPLPAGSEVGVAVGGRGGVPLDAAAVVLNVTVIDATAAGYLSVYPCGSPRPNASNVNFEAGDTIPNAVVAKVGAGGAVCLYSSTATHVAVDANGYFPAGAGYQALVPARLADTRSGTTTVDGQDQGVGTRPAGSTFTVRASGRGGVSSSAAALVLNVTAIDPKASGYLTVFPCDAPQPNASSLNFVPGRTVANAVVVKPGGGYVCIYTSAGTDVAADVNGFFP